MSGLSVMMSKGERPAIISNISTPSAHQSTLNPEGGPGWSGQNSPFCAIQSQGNSCDLDLDHS